ncbi:hypothetical protein MMC06_002281 [Schaereria dolodes]|nr:hypothetical protein [Schaereria dolodes]
MPRGTLHGSPAPAFFYRKEILYDPAFTFPRILKPLNVVKIIMPSFDVNTGDQVVRTFAAALKGKTGELCSSLDPVQVASKGAQTAIILPQWKPKEIILAGRTKSKIQPVIDLIRKDDPDVAIGFIKLDLADQSSILQAVKEISGRINKPDVLINNAGVMALKNYTTTTDGIEMQFGTNHIGHFLLTNLVMNKILAAGKGSRIINVYSFGYSSGGVRFDDHNFQDGEIYNSWTAYSRSKTTNIVFTSYLADRLKSRGVTILATNPGQLMSDVDQAMFTEGKEIASKAMEAKSFLSS